MPMQEPVRKIKSNPEKNTGRFSSFKLGRMVGYESLLERDFIYLLEFSPRIKTYCEQPTKIDYTHLGRTFSYCPDFQCVFADGQVELWEIKPSELAEKEENRIKMRVLAQYCRERRWMAKMATENDLPSVERLENIKFLTYYRQKPADGDEILSQIKLILNSQKEMALASLLERSPETKDKALICLYHLLYMQSVSMNWDRPLGMNTVLSLIKKPEATYDPVRFWE